MFEQLESGWHSTHVSAVDLSNMTTMLALWTESASVTHAPLWLVFFLTMATCRKLHTVGVLCSAVRLHTLLCRGGRRRKRRATPSILRCQPGSLWPRAPRGTSRFPSCRRCRPVRHQTKNCEKFDFTEGSGWGARISPDEEQWCRRRWSSLWGLPRRPRAPSPWPPAASFWPPPCPHLRMLPGTRQPCQTSPVS